ncbi:MAG: hypothetical protein P4L95_00870 [Rouxiella aceris]|uniref:hypothetical protein n=1 Tax=Rouxiella aceris TaxID=2703884 RepID=UPI00284B923F|nr:hypothetical protein [Rouxiella aceris]MDR3430448.1 hypothetical protein [Rouxiella aceris]
MQWLTKPAVNNIIPLRHISDGVDCHKLPGGQRPSASNLKITYSSSLMNDVLGNKKYRRILRFYYPELSLKLLLRIDFFTLLI